VLLAVAHGSGGRAAGYTGPQLVMYIWVTQGLIYTVGMWGDVALAERIRTGDVVADLLRPVPPVLSYLATDLGRAAFAMLTRFVAPVLVGALFFEMYLPRRAVTYPLFGVAVLLATVVSFACRYAVSACAYWLLDARGPLLAWTLVSNVLSGLYFPLAFLPGWLDLALWWGTPFPYLLQGPVDVLVERHSVAGTVGLVAGALAWSGLTLALAGYVQRRGEHRMVIQGG
jgi:ABC-2 type transport system permease protein